jgi:hypothetical protein
LADRQGAPTIIGFIYGDAVYHNALACTDHIKGFIFL